jgi:hypothetical protein
MVSEVAVIDYYDTINSVVSLMLQGYNPTQISKELKMKRSEVMECIEEWKRMGRQSNQVQERAKDAITGADQHYSMVIFKLWETIEQAESEGDLRLKKDTLNTIASVEDKRIGMLQKAGLLDNQEMAHQVAETERKQKILTDILREIATEHPEVRMKILQKLSKVTGQAEGVVLEQ